MITARRPATHRVRSGSTVDGKGNRVAAYTNTPRRVYGWGPARPAEVQAAGITTTSAVVELLAPTFPVDTDDRFILAGEEYEVIGSADVDHTPGMPRPGMTVYLTRSS